MVTRSEVDNRHKKIPAGRVFLWVAPGTLFENLPNITHLSSGARSVAARFIALIITGARGKMRDESRRYRVCSWQIKPLNRNNKVDTRYKKTPAGRGFFVC